MELVFLSKAGLITFEECKKYRCQFDVLKVFNGVCSVNLDRCVGCGVCAITCPKEALSLVAREGSFKSTPPETLRDWMIQKAISRNVNPSDLL